MILIKIKTIAVQSKAYVHTYMHTSLNGTQSFCCTRMCLENTQNMQHSCAERSKQSIFFLPCKFPRTTVTYTVVHLHDYKRIHSHIHTSIHSSVARHVGYYNISLHPVCLSKFSLRHAIIILECVYEQPPLPPAPIQSYYIRFI